MNNSKESLTEFEGALLAGIRRFGDCTPYQVRQAFETSPSPEWSGSSGAVYPAIKRLVTRGLLAERRSTDDKRGTKKVSLTEAGARALLDWAVDIDTAVGPGLDPFRSRSTEWETLSNAKRQTHMRKLEHAVKERVSELKRLAREDASAPPSQIELDIALQEARLKWLRKQGMT